MTLQEAIAYMAHHHEVHGPISVQHEVARNRVLDAARNWEFHQQVDPECEAERR